MPEKNDKIEYMTNVHFFANNIFSESGQFKGLVKTETNVI